MKRFVLKKDDRTRFTLLMAILLLGVTFKCLFQVSIPSIVFILIPALIVFFGDRDEILAMCVCCIPLFSVLKFQYIVVICVAIYLCKYARDIKLDFTFVFALLVIMWEISHWLVAASNLKMFIVFLVPYILLVMVISIGDVRIDYGFIVRSFSISVCFVCFVLLTRVLVISNFDLNMAFVNMTRLGLSTEEDAAALIINPNTLGFICLLGITGLIQLKMHGQAKAYDMFLMLSMLVGGILTLSKTYAVCLFIMAILFFAVSSGDLNKKMSQLMRALLVVLVLILILAILFPSVIDEFISRFEVTDITSGRLRLFNQYNEYLRSSSNTLLYGVGILEFGNKVVNTYSIADNVPHNAIQEILVAWGIPGLIFLVGLILSMIWRSKKENPSQKLVNYIPLIILLAKSQVGQMITSNYTMLSLVFVYLSLRADFDSNNKKL